MDERRSPAHPVAERGCVMGNVLGMVLMPRKMVFHIDHRIDVARYEEIDQREKDGGLFNLSLSSHH